jgi:phytoene dehydrogenase-like protein
MSETYGSISIGSGLAGLTASAFAATEGKRVLVLEQHTKIGGVATHFVRHGVRFECGLHQIDGLDPGDAKMAIFARFGVREALRFIPTGEFYAVRSHLLGEQLTMPYGDADPRAAMLSRFPQHAAALKKYFDTIFLLRRKVSAIAKHQGKRLHWLLQAPILPIRFWIIGRHEKTCVGPFLDQLFGDDEAVKLALAANLGYYDADADAISLLFFATAQGSYYLGGCHYIDGGGQALSDHLAGIIRAHGGTVRTGRRVARILVDRGRAVGVEHVDAASGGDPQEERANALFGNAAPAHLAAMLPEELRARFEAPYAALPYSVSLWQMYLTLDRPPAAFGADAYSTFVFPPWQRTLRQNVENLRLVGADPGERLPAYVLVDYDRLNAGIGGPGNHVAVVCGFDTLANWRDLEPAAYKARKAAWIEAILADLDVQFPGIRAAVKHKEMATARTMARYLGTPEGAIYGYAQVPSAAGRFRPTPWTATPGVYLASAFARPGGGFTGAMLAGAGAYRAARRDRTLG